VIGQRRALVLACLGIVQTYVVIFSVPPLISTFVDDLGWSHAEAGGLMAAFTLAYCAGGLPAGRLADRFGAARVMAAGVIVAGAGSLLGALSDELVPLLLSRLVVGLANACCWTAGVIFLLQVLPASRASAGIGWFTGALCAGGAIAFLATPPLEEAFGWRGVFVLYGAVAVVGGGLVLFSLRDQVGTRVVGAVAVPVGEVLRERRLLVVSGTLFLGMAAAYGPLTWVPPFMDEVAGFSTTQRSVAGLIMSLAAIPGAILAGIVADRTGRPAHTSAVFLVPCIPIAFLAFGAESSYVLVTLLATMCSFGSCGAVTPLFATAGSTVRPAAAATAAGVATMIGISGTVAATYGGGLLVSYAGGYDAAFIVFGAVAAAGILSAPAAGRALRPRSPQPAPDRAEAIV
jgi:predicted MFS family arabinose efflux permease